jgi:hypothetical protein
MEPPETVDYGKIVESRLRGLGCGGAAVDMPNAVWEWLRRHDSLWGYPPVRVALGGGAPPSYKPLHGVLHGCPTKGSVRLRGGLRGLLLPRLLLRPLQQGQRGLQGAVVGRCRSFLRGEWE